MEVDAQPRMVEEDTRMETSEHAAEAERAPSGAKLSRGTSIFFTPIYGVYGARAVRTERREQC
jgi:hypothetical protein